MLDYSFETVAAVVELESALDLLVERLLLEVLILEGLTLLGGLRRLGLLELAKLLDHKLGVQLNEVVDFGVLVRHYHLVLVFLVQGVVVTRVALGLRLHQQLEELAVDALDALLALAVAAEELALEGVVLDVLAEALDDVLLELEGVLELIWVDDFADGTLRVVWVGREATGGVLEVFLFFTHKLD